MPERDPKHAVFTDAKGKDWVLVPARWRRAVIAGIAIVGILLSIAIYVVGNANDTTSKAASSAERVSKQANRLSKTNKEGQKEIIRQREKGRRLTVQTALQLCQKFKDTNAGFSAVLQQAADEARANPDPNQTEEQRQRGEQFLAALLDSLKVNCYDLPLLQDPSYSKYVPKDPAKR